MGTIWAVSIAPELTAPSPRPHVVVCGDDALAYRLAEELIARDRAEVTVLLPSTQRNHGPRLARLPVRVVESERLDDDALREAGVESASALALVRQDDVGNIQAGLQAQEMNPGLRLVIRMFNMNLGNGIRRLFTDCAVMSDALMAAPAFVAAALGEVAPTHVRLPGHTLYVARRAEVRPADVVCPLAVTGSDGRPDLLPADGERADLVLAHATGKGAGVGTPPTPEQTGRLRRWLPRRRPRPVRALFALAGRKLGIAVLVLLGLFVAATVLRAIFGGISLVNAAYVTLLDIIGGTTPDVHAKAATKVIDAVLALMSIALIPLITAAVAGAVVNARLSLALGRLRGPTAGHVVVVGLGNVGTRVIRQLHDLGIQIVAIDKNESARGVQVAREHGIPFIVGDASRVETLRAAYVQTCRALVVVSTDDVANLEAALHGRTLKEDLRVVLRLFDGDFADRVQRTFGITSSRSVSSLAAPAFAAAMLEREVIATIPVSRRVLLIAEVGVGAGSALDGQPLAAAEETGQARVIGLMSERGPVALRPEPGRLLAAADRLVVVATRAGLGGLRQRSATPLAEAEPAESEPARGPGQVA